MSVNLSNYSMVTSGVNLSNQSSDIVANSTSVIEKDKVIELKELFLSKLGAITDIVGLPVEVLNSLQQLAEAINSDSDCFNNILSAINLKSDLAYVNTELDSIVKQILNYDTIDTTTINLNLQSTITYVDTSCQATVNRFQ